MQNPMLTYFDGAASVYSMPKTPHTMPKTSDRMAQPSHNLPTLHGALPIPLSTSREIMPRFILMLILVLLKV